MKYRLILIVSILALLVSCVKKEDITFSGIEGVDINGLTDVTIRALVGNDSRTDVQILDANFNVTRDGTKLATIVLRNEIVVPKKSSGVVKIPFRGKISNPLAALSLVNINESDYDTIYFSGTVTVKAGAIKKKVNVTETALSDIMRKFGNVKEIKLDL